VKIEINIFAKEKRMSGASAKKMGKTEETWVHAQKGLCSTCALASECTFPRHPQIPVMHCDEFKGYEDKPVETRDMMTHAPVVAVSKDFLAGENIGLCRNCKHRNHCTFPKPAGGVLCCDEYE
jgi:hypothetical protein